MTSAEAKQVVSMLQSAWPRNPMPDSTIAVYAMALSDLDFALAKGAVVKLIQTAKWLPTVSEIRDAAVRSRVSLPSPEEAWGLVHRAISKHGSYRTPTFDCDEIDGAVQDIGWRAICLSENIASERARFIDAFKGRAARRYELEATGKYIAPQKALPPAWRSEGERPVGDTRVLVQTGYATDERRRLGAGEVVLELQAEPEERSVIGDALKLLIDNIGVDADKVLQ